MTKALSRTGSDHKRSKVISDFPRLADGYQSQLVLIVRHTGRTVVILKSERS